jgi:3-oxo-5-alpha-steroid 4-dehydrogenase 1
LFANVDSQVTTAQWVLDWYPQGKTSIESKWNIDGKIGWATMESAGFMVLLYIMYALPKELGISELPWGNWTMAGCFVSSSIVWYYSIWSLLTKNR